MEPPIQQQTFLRWTIQIQTYHDSGLAGRMAADCRRYTGGTMFRVVPFTGTGYTSNVAGGRLPPLRQICYKYRVLNVSIIVLHPNNAEKRGKNNPCGYTEPPDTRTIVNCQLSIVNLE